MTGTLTLVAPGHALADSGRSVVLLDDQWYPAEHFAKAAARVEAGSGVECVERGGEPGFALTKTSRDVLAGVSTCDTHVLFFVSTDTDVKTLMPIAQKCATATFLVHSVTDESAVEVLSKQNVSFEMYGSYRLRPGAADLAVLSNDAGFERRDFVAACRRNGIRTVCLQEATNVDFERAPYRMQWADIALIQGPHALQYLTRDVYFLTGNPRFDSHRPLPFPDKPLVLINCNFIFGLAFLEWMRPWTEQAIDAAVSLDLPYRITVHPRDETDLSGLENVQPSGAYRVHDQLKECTVLISRDSSLPYEALMLNRHTIYYDPFGERERCLREDDTGFIEKCTTPEGLRDCLETVLGKPPTESTPERNNRAGQFLFTGRDGQSDLRVVRALHIISTHPKLYATNDARRQSQSLIAANRFLHVTLRPKLRRIQWLRKIWRMLKALKMRAFGY